MKTITLLGPFVVNDVVRHPVEGSLIVSDEEAARLKAAGVLADEPEDVAKPTAPDPTVEDLEAMTVADLHILVTKEGVPLNDATKKGDIIAAIQKHRAEKA